ncbi:MAG: translational GTPase TypA [Verrucomicrobia bacterium]|nr:translational GTPase TypA [Verrucomicrobiota bacterium]
MNEQIRNIGIIAHVDHGKTTLVDKLLRASGLFRDNERVQERAMDSMDLEQEKGITIRSKNAAVHWKGVRINLVDTPGHADFGGEVERILNMVDGVLLLVDAAEGPQAQTRFVLRKALAQDLDLIVVVNKIDRDLADPMKTHDKVLELLLELNAGERQFHAPFIYASARDGYAVHEIGDEPQGMGILFDTVVEHVRAPEADPKGQFHMLISNLDWSDYVGRIAIGKIASGSVKVGESVVCINKEGRRQRAIISRLYRFSGMGTVEAEQGHAGDIVGLAGFKDAYIGETLCNSEDQHPVPFVEIDPPTIQMQICVNDGPLAGREGKLLTARHIRERLIRETRTNISLEVSDTSLGSAFKVSARGELQIAVLVETMRREGFELLVSRPEVIYRVEDGRKLEPFETLWLEVTNDALGDILQNLASRKARTVNMEHHGSMVHLESVIPTRGLIGFESFLVNRTSGEAVISHMFKEYAPFCGEIASRNSGTLVSMVGGTATGYALDTIQERGRLFIGPQDEVYEGMIIGENARSEDMPVNPTRTKQLTNVRASGSDKAIMLEPPIRMSLERAIEFISADEYVEATPKKLRLRKKILRATMRKRAAQQG